MALQSFVVSASGAGVIANLGDTDDLYVAAGITIASSNDATISATGSNQILHIAGTVVGYNRTFIVGGDPSLDTGAYVHIEKTAHLESFNSGTWGERFDAVNSTVENEGSVVAHRLGAFYFNGSSTTTTSNFENSGSVEAKQDAAITNVGTETLDVHNTGTLSGKWSFSGSSSGVSHIVNDGKMVGDVSLGTGADTYDGRKGSVKGKISGGSGADKLYGGKEANELHGDAGADKIYGAGGADKLYGGADADTFIYNAISESTPTVRDKIYDFEHIDVIDLGSIDAKTSTSKNDAFTFIGNNAYDNHSGELRYAFSGSDTIFSGDVNGDGKSDFSVKLAGHVTLTQHDFLL